MIAVHFFLAVDVLKKFVESKAEKSVLKVLYMFSVDIMMLLVKMLILLFLVNHNRL